MLCKFVCYSWITYSLSLEHCAHVIHLDNAWCAVVYSTIKTSTKFRYKKQCEILKFTVWNWRLISILNNQITHYHNLLPSLSLPLKFNSVMIKFKPSKVNASCSWLIASHTIYANHSDIVHCIIATMCMLVQISVDKKFLTLLLLHCLPYLTTDVSCDLFSYNFPVAKLESLNMSSKTNTWLSA